MEAWQDLATIYTELGALLDANTCVDKAQFIEFFNPRSWHVTGMFKYLINHDVFVSAFLLY